MKYQMSELQLKARKKESDIKSLKNMDDDSLRNKAMRNKKKYHDFVKSKHKNHTFHDDCSCLLVEGSMEYDTSKDIVSLSDGEREKKKADKVETVNKEQINSRENKGLPALFKCGELIKEKAHLMKYGDCLYVYNGKCYDIIDSNGVISLYRDRVDDKLGFEKNLSSISQLYKFLCTDSSIVVEKLPKNRRIAVLRNGIYDVMGEKLFPHSHKEIVFSYINSNYVEGEGCKCFDQFLRDVTDGDKVLQERLWMFLGYTFMQTTEAKVFFVMGEAPDSGKSLLGNFIESLYPKGYVSNIALMDFNRNFAIAPIARSAINISLDLPSSRLNTMAVSKLKMLTGGDAVNINQKYVAEYRYENRAKLIFASNFAINLIEPDDAFWNRLIYLPFNKSVPKAKQDRDLPEKFQRERDAIVSKALRYAKKLILLDFCFPTTTQIERKMQEWQGRTCATIENFINDCCICSEELRGELVDNLYQAYEKYCDDTGYVAKNYYIFKRFLEEQLGLIHFKMRDGGENPQSAFKGISLRDKKGREML